MLASKTSIVENKKLYSPTTHCKKTVISDQPLMTHLDPLSVQVDIDQSQLNADTVTLARSGQVISMPLEFFNAMLQWMDSQYSGLMWKP